MPNFISEDDIEVATAQRLQRFHGHDTLNCHTADPSDLNDSSGRTDKCEVILPRLFSGKLPVEDLNIQFLQEGSQQSTETLSLKRKTEPQMAQISADNKEVNIDG